MSLKTILSHHPEMWGCLESIFLPNLLKEHKAAYTQVVTFGNELKFFPFFAVKVGKGPIVSS